MATNVTEPCDWCLKPIISGAKVCSKCGRHQGWIGWFSVIGVVIGVFVSLSSAVYSGASVTRTVMERVEINEAREEIVESLEILRMIQEELNSIDALDLSTDQLLLQ